MNIKTAQKGILFAFIAAVISGFSIFYAKYTVLKIDPLILTTSRNFTVGLIFLLLVLKNKNIALIHRLSKKQITGLLFIAICGAVPFFLFFTGLSLIAPLTANAIHKTLFIWVGLFSYLFFKEKINTWMKIGYVLILGGQLFISHIHIGIGYGELFVFTATLIWAVEHLITKRLFSSLPIDLVGLVRMGGGSILLLLASIATGRFHLFLTISSFPLIVPVIIGSFILFAYVFFWYKALEMQKVSVVSFILTFSVVIGGLLNSIINKTALLPTEILVMFFICVSVAIISFSEFKHIHDPAHT